MKKRRWHPLQLLAPFLVSWWHNHPSPWNIWKMWTLWDTLDEIEKRDD